MLAIGCGGRTSGSSRGASGGVGGTGAPNGSGAATGAIVATAGLTTGTVELSGSGGADPTEAGITSVCGIASTVVICTRDVSDHCVCLSDDPTRCAAGTVGVASVPSEAQGCSPAEGYTCQSQCGPGQYGFSECGPFPDGGPTSDVPPGCTYVPTPVLPGYACCPIEPQSISDASTQETGADASAPETGADAGTAPSCAPGGPGMTNCSPGGGGTESCCTSLEVTGGTYYRTYTSDADGGASALAAPATVSSFRLDKYDVTVGRFRQFVDAALPSDGGAGWFPAPGSGKHTYLNGGNGLNATGGGYEPGWLAADDVNIAPMPCGLPSDTWTASVGSQENLPINCVNWYEAYAFCIWDGGFLPSEAEWVYAAEGGDQERAYPWGSTAPGTGNQFAIYGYEPGDGCYYPSAGPCTGVNNIAPVGTASLGAGRWGQVDLMGEAQQWSLDRQGYPSSWGMCTDCVTPEEPGIPLDVVIPGAAYDAVLSSPATFSTSQGAPDLRVPEIGFRCARSP
jgi:sulfatase modifying factor 1